MFHFTYRRAVARMAVMNTGVLAAAPAHRPPDGRAVTVLVVAPHPLVRRGLRNLLSPHRGFRVVTECSTVDDGARFAGRNRPDVVRRSAGFREGECDQPEDAAWSRLRIAPTFTPREAQVLAMLVRGDRNERIAEALGVRASTVKFHVRGLLRKFGVENRTQIAYIAAKNDLA